MIDAEKLVPVHRREDIFEKYLNTPIGDLLEYHNLRRPLDHCKQAKMLVGMCMDNRKDLRRPKGFAFILRTGGANLKDNEFKISYAIAIAGLEHLALIGHTNCGMVNLHERKDIFINGLVEHAGWTHDAAKKHFEKLEPVFEITDEIDFTLAESKRLGRLYPKLKVAPLLYNVEDGKIYQIKD